jgi:hypothetical protein
MSSVRMPSEDGAADVIAFQKNLIAAADAHHLVADFVRSGKPGSPAPIRAKMAAMRRMVWASLRRVDCWRRQEPRSLASLGMTGMNGVGMNGFGFVFGLEFVIDTRFTSNTLLHI